MLSTIPMANTDEEHNLNATVLFNDLQHTPTYKVTSEAEPQEQIMSASKQKRQRKKEAQHKNLDENELIRLIAKQEGEIQAFLRKQEQKGKIVDEGKKTIYTKSSGNEVVGATKELRTMYEKLVKLNQLFVSEDMPPLEGYGLKRKRIYKRPLRFLSGCGTVVNKKDNLYKLNKFYVDMEKLSQNILSVKYCQNRNIVSKLPQQRVSNNVRDCIKDLCLKGTFDINMFNHMTQSDKILTHCFLDSCHWN